MMLVSAVIGGFATVAGAGDAGKVQIKFDLPRPQFTGTPRPIRSANLEPSRNGRLYPPIEVPVGCDKLLSKGCKVTASSPEPMLGELPVVTDGDKEHDAETYVELDPHKQWVQIDLGQEREIHAVCIWHFHGEARVYRDVICQIANDPNFAVGVVTVFNNDHDNSSGLGAGKDKEYVESNEGRPFPVNGVRGRYIRFYSNGNTSDDMNHYTETEIYGKP